ncbi:hypothetical protein RHS02_03518, partial [Rhizoctonia solani]
MAQSTTSKTTHNIIKYASHKVPLSAQVPTNEIQWKSHEGEHLRLTIAVTAVRAPSGSGTQPMARHVLKIVYLSEDVEEIQNASQSMASEALLENLDLTSFSEIKYSGRELPLKAVYKNRSVAFRYLYPMIQNGNTPQTYRRFQVTFKTADDTLNFIDSIKYICPCSTARDQRPTETHVTEQANSTQRPPSAMVIEGSAKTAPHRRIAPINRPITPSRISNLPLPRNATTYRKSTMFADILSSPSLGTGNSQARGAPGSSSGSSASGGKSANPTQVKPTMDEVVIDRGELVDEPNHIIVDEGPLTEPGRAEATNISQVGRAIAQHAPSPNQPEETQFSAPTRVGTNQSRAHVQVSREGQQLQPRAIEILHAAEETPGESTKIVPGIRQLRDASDIYTMPFDELQQLVAEVIREPGFPELVSSDMYLIGWSSTQNVERKRPSRGTARDDGGPMLSSAEMLISRVWTLSSLPTGDCGWKVTPDGCVVYLCGDTDFEFIVFASADIQMGIAGLVLSHHRLTRPWVTDNYYHSLTMATRPPLPHHGSHPGPARHHLTRLHVPQSISISPGYFSEQALFTPGPNTAQVSQAAFMANNFPQGPQTAFLLNTPGPTQSTFLAQQQQPRPGPMHRHHASIAMGMPLTPGGGVFQQQQQSHFASMGAQNPPPMGGLGVPPFVPRSRRTISIGGPPKAVLGGPNRKTSPLPPTPAGENAPLLPDVKRKKCTVRLPLESDQEPEADAGDADESAKRTRSLWSREPVPPSQLPPQVTLDDQLDIMSVEPHPEHIKQGETLAPRINLSSKIHWDIMRQEIIEQKLAKLGVERGSGAAYLPSQAHGRAFSRGDQEWVADKFLSGNQISTPADPSLLFSKLNKLQASQSPSSTSSPGPNSPFFTQPRLPQHGYTQSLAVKPQFGFSPQLNGALDLTTQKSPNLSTSVSMVSDSESQGPILYAPQGIVPVRATALSRPDFIRGFGLDVTEEEDEGQEDEEAADTQTPSDGDENGSNVHHDANGGFTQAFGQPFPVKPVPLAHSQPEPTADEEDADDEGDDSMTAAAHSRHHSRHLSHASLRSLGRRTMSEEPPASRGVREEDLPEGESEYEQSQARSAVETWDMPNDTPEVAESDSGHYEEGLDGVADWTGSDTESTGEWSNPSDEERAREERRLRKMNRRQDSVNVPRRIPEFPHPPHVPAEPYVPMRVERAQSEDIVSNPSEEGFVHVQTHEDGHLHQSGNLSPRPFRPLPPVPQSASHSRQPSANLIFNHPGSAELRHVESGPHSRGQSLVSQPGANRDALNPLAKPFVFGSIRGSSTSSIPISQPVRGSVGSPSEFGPIAPPPGAHSRQASVSTAAPVPTTTKLNAGAVEFKPSGGMFSNASFTFKLPPGVPTLAFGSGDSTSRHSLVEPPLQSPARATQGREKRQRRISDGVGLENTELDSPVEPMQKDTPGRDNIATWRYPQPVGSPAVVPKTETTIPKPMLNPAAKPFSFNGPTTLSRATLPADTPQPSVSAPVEKTPLSIFAPQSKRATLPEFALPSTGNTVPASVFKSLVQSDGPTRPTVRSRLSSREAFEAHSNRPSLDDINVPSISSRKTSKPILTVQNPNTPPQPTTDVFGPIHSSAQKPLSKSPIPGFLKLGPPPRRPSPSPAKSRLFSPNLVPSSPSDIGAGDSDIQTAVQNALDAKLDSWRKELTGSLAGVRDSKETRKVNNLSGPSELDLELIRSTIESGQVTTRSMLQRELGTMMERMDLISAAQVPHTLDSSRIAEGLGSSVLQPLAQLSSQISSLQENIHQQKAATQQDLLEQLTSALRPHFEAARAVPIDTEALTIQLSQAVKPHISQLIDLASDKRETATLIVQHLTPALNNIQPPKIDVNNLATQIALALKSAIPPPTDPYVIKEHVADLVVERLDSRLAVRDSSYNTEAISKRVMEALVPILQPTELASAVTKIDEMAKHQESVLLKTQDLLKAQEVQSAGLGGLPKSLEEAIATLKSSHTEFIEKLRSFTPLDEVQKIGATNLELHTQLGNARAAHAQVCGEKDVLADRLRAAEQELASLRAAAAERESTSTSQATELSSLKVKEASAQAALSESQVKLERSESLLRVNQDRIASLEKTNHEQNQQNHELQLKVNTLELQVTYATRDLESSKRIVSQLETQRNNLMAQQKHWDDLRRTAERVENLCQQMEREDSEEIVELKRTVDENKILQGEHAYLKKRYDEQERRIADFTRGQQTAKQTITQAQQQAAEWERRAKEADTELDTYRSRAEELEDANTRLHQDFTQLQLKVKDLTETEEKQKQQNQTMQNQIVALEHQLDALKTELAEAARPQTPVAPIPQRNGVVTGLPVGLPRSVSRLSQGTPVYTPTRQGPVVSLHGTNGLTNGKLDLASEPTSASSSEGVWASMHAPSNDGFAPPQTPRPSHARQAQHHRPRVPSPTHSVVSSMTRDEDGWYS